MSEPGRKVRRIPPPALASDEVYAPRVDFAEVIRGLSSGEAEDSVAMTEYETYASRACVFSLGDPQTGLYLVKVGFVEEYRLTEDGNKLPINRSGPGKFLALGSVEGAIENLARSPGPVHPRFRSLSLWGGYMPTKSSAKTGSPD